MSISYLPALLAKLSGRFRVDDARWARSGQLSLSVDNQPRVRLQRGLGADLHAEVRLAHLPRPGIAQSSLLDRMMLRATAHALDHVAVLSLARDGETLLCQVTLDGSDISHLKRNLEAFLNEVDYWIAVIGDDA